MIVLVLLLLLLLLLQALAYLKPSAILKQITASSNLEVITPKGPGVAIRYQDKSSTVLVRLHTPPGAEEPFVVVDAKEVECPRAR